MKQVILTIAFMVSCFAMEAQNIAPLFTAMPDSFTPQLESAWRKDLVDLYKEGKSAKLQNTMDGTSILKTLSDDYVDLQITDVSALQLKLLPLVNNTYIICMVNTVAGPVKDSRISFYTTDWNPLDAKDLFTPSEMSSFIKARTDQTAAEYKEARLAADMLLVEYRLNPANTELEAILTTPQYLGKEQRALLMPFINETPLIYSWEKSRFVAR